MRLTRRGTTLVELTVALTLGGVVVGLLAHAVIAQRRSELAGNRTRGAAVATDEATRVVAALMSRLPTADSVAVRGDTAVDFGATIGVAIACAASGDSVIVPDAGASSWWEGVPDSGDALHLDWGNGQRNAVELTDVSSRSSAGVCGVPHFALRVAPLLGTSGTPLVRVIRRRRVMHYRAGDGTWWLGERVCTARPVPTCGSAQPIAGPLAAYPIGFRLALDSTWNGRVRVAITAASGRARSSALIALWP